MSTANSSLLIRVGVAGTFSAMQQIRALSGGIIRELGGPLAALATVGGFAALSKSALNFADTLGKTKQVIGVSVKELSGMAFAAERSNVELGSLRIGMKSFSEWLAKSGQGSKNLKTALLEQAAIFEKMPDGIYKTNRAMDLFGKAGLQMVPLLNEGPEKLQQLFERGQRLSGVNDDLARSANEFNDAMSDMRVAAQGLAGALALNLLPAITRTLNAATEGIVRFREWTKESIAFKLAIEGLSVSLGVFAAYRIGGAAVGGFAAFIGAGAIKSMSDFIAALKLLPAVAATAIKSVAALAAQFALLATGIVTAIEQMRMWKAIHQEGDAIRNLAEQNERFAASLLKSAEARKEAGQLSEKEFADIRRRIFAARALREEIDVAAALNEVSQNMIPKGSDKGGTQWSEALLDFKRKELDLEIERGELMKARNRLAFENTHTSAYVKTGMGGEDGFNLSSPYEKVAKFDILKKNIELMDAQLSLLETQRDDAYEAMKQGAIEQIKYDETDLDIQKKILAIQKERAETQKILATRTFGGSFSENMGKDLEQWGNVSGNLGRDTWESMKLGINGVSDSITGAITGMRSWRDVSLEVGRQVLAMFVKTSVEGVAAFVLGENLKTFAAKMGFAKRAAIWVGETIFHGAQIATRVATHIAGEVAMTIASLVNSGKRIAVALKESLVWVIKAAVKAASSVADIPYVGWALALAALAGVTAAGVSAIASARERGGPVEAGKPYIVGERRAELFVPDQSGYILPSVPDNFYSGAGASPSVNVAAAPVNVVVVNDRSELKRFLESRAGERIVVKHIGKSTRGEIEIDS